MTPRRAGRRLVAVTAVVMVAAVPLLPGPAWADGAVAAPAEPVVQHGKVALSGTVDFSERDPLELRLTVPGGPAQVVASVGAAELGQSGRTLSFELTTAPCNVPNTCTPGRDAPNGGWLLELVQLRPAQLGGPELLAQRTFVVDVPARAPSRVDAALTGSRQVTVSWARGTEPDLLGWQVSDDDQLRSLAPAAAGCDDSGTCSTVFDYPARASGSRTFSVAAVRACGVPDCRPVTSSRVTTDPVKLPATPSPSPSSSPSNGAGGPGGSGGTGGAGGGGGSAAGGSTSAAGSPTTAAAAFSEGFSSFGPKLGLPKLPPLPLSSVPSVADAEIADGTFEGSLGYDDEVVREPVAAPGGRTSVLKSSGGLLDDEQLMRSLAGALLLLLVAAHLRSWLSRSRDEAELHF